jgi:hypothetical protein
LSRVAAVVAELLSLAERIRSGDEPGEAVTELLMRARLVARAAQPREVEELQRATAVLAAAVTERMEEIEQALRDTGSRRSAIAAYGSLRPYHSAQNLRTRV